MMKTGLNDLNDEMVFVNLNLNCKILQQRFRATRYKSTGLDVNRMQLVKH